MTDLKPCIRCERPIDRYAKICVYCNWDQTNSNVPPPQTASSASTYVPPPDNRARNRILGAIGLFVLIVGAFAVGMFAFHGSDAKEVKTAQNEAVPQVAENSSTRKRSDVTLVPIDGADPSLTVPIEQSITSAPPLVPGQDANDATALPSEQYAAAAAKAKEYKKAQRDEVDPRSLRGRAFESPVTPPPMASSQQPQPRVPAPAPAEDNNIPRRPSSPSPSLTPAPIPERERAGPRRTEAYPEYKPLPSIRVDEDTTARLTLTVGADGRVKGVDISEPIPGETSKLIAAVQRWRFRPATENGTPVSARVAVTITLHGNE